MQVYLREKNFLLYLKHESETLSKNERKETEVKSKKHTYERDLPRRLYTFFACYDDERSAPSFQKFARAQGMTTEELLAFRRAAENLGLTKDDVSDIMYGNAARYLNLK